MQQNLGMRAVRFRALPEATGMAYQRAVAVRLSGETFPALPRCPTVASHSAVPIITTMPPAGAAPTGMRSDSVDAHR